MSAVQAWKAAVQQLQEVHEIANRHLQLLLANPNSPAAHAAVHSMCAAAIVISQSNVGTAVCSDAACKEVVLNLKVGTLHTVQGAGVFVSCILGLG
jgi:hypothetical protein